MNLLLNEQKIDNDFGKVKNLLIHNSSRSGIIEKFTANAVICLNISLESMYCSDNASCDPTLDWNATLR